MALITLLTLIIKSQLQQDWLMLRRNSQIPFSQLQNTLQKKTLESSVSTENSSPKNSEQPNYCRSSFRNEKQKSQLCKKYLENGFCPYQRKCKFAHGSHQLRKNHLPNSKYKTKECGVYLQTGHCMYGQRCNFIHKLGQIEGDTVRRDAEWWEVKAEARFQSRLLTLLNLV